MHNSFVDILIEHQRASQTAVVYLLSPGTMSLQKRDPYYRDFSVRSLHQSARRCCQSIGDSFNFKVRRLLKSQSAVVAVDKCQRSIPNLGIASTSLWLPPELSTVAEFSTPPIHRADKYVSLASLSLTTSLSIK